MDTRSLSSTSAVSVVDVKSFAFRVVFLGSRDAACQKACVSKAIDWVRRTALVEQHVWPPMKPTRAHEPTSSREHTTFLCVDISPREDRAFPDNNMAMLPPTVPDSAVNLPRPKNSSFYTIPTHQKDRMTKEENQPVGMGVCRFCWSINTSTEHAAALWAIHMRCRSDVLVVSAGKEYFNQSKTLFACYKQQRVQSVAKTW
ncbi:hypothetical protein GW17_00014907 [Ensete ventricosum]|nr:hypothetical protein GW17_00014907 [Ensete ventricosum]